MYLLATSDCCEDVTPEGRQVDWNVPISSVRFPKHSSRNTGRFRNVVSAVMNPASVRRSLVRYSGCSYAVRDRALCGETPFCLPFCYWLGWNLVWRVHCKCFVFDFALVNISSLLAFICIGSMNESLLRFTGHLVAQVASLRSITADVRFQHEYRPRGMCGGQGFTGRFSPRALRFFLIPIIPPLLHILS
jgi:hypothetical protein